MLSEEWSREQGFHFIIHVSHHPFVPEILFPYVPPCPPRSQFLHPVRFREAGMDRDTREQADSEGNGVVKISAPLLECRRQSPKFGGIRFTVNLSIPGRNCKLWTSKIYLPELRTYWRQDSKLTPSLGGKLFLFSLGVFSACICVEFGRRRWHKEPFSVVSWILSLLSLVNSQRFPSA